MTNTHPREENLRPSDPRNAARVAAGLTRTGVSPGDIARLKRMNPEYPTEKTFWHECIRLGIDQAQEDLVKTWAGIFSMIANGTKVTEEGATGPHNGYIPMGKALATTGYSELRLKVLLNADESSIPKILHRATSHLYSKGHQFNWNDAARLAMTRHRNQQERESDRIRMARDYYREAQPERTGQEG